MKFFCENPFTSSKFVFFYVHICYTFFQAYHSSFTNNSATVGNLALLPIKTHFRGPAPTLNGDELDIIDEALYFFRANVFFRTYEIKVSYCSSISFTFNWYTVFYLPELQRVFPSLVEKPAYAMVHSQRVQLAALAEGAHVFGSYTKPFDMSYSYSACFCNCFINYADLN